MDEKIKKALGLFAEGKDRHEVAKRLGYKNYKVLDMYFRRRNYRWNANQGTYTLMDEAPSLEETVQEAAVLSKPQQIISLLCLPDKDPRAVAKQVGFRDIQQMADYMAERGFAWDSESGNYIRNTGVVETVSASGACEDSEEQAVNTSSIQPSQVQAETNTMQVAIGEGQSNAPPTGDMAQYLPLLALLQKNKEKLIDLITIKQEKKMPRYTLAGACTAKSLQIPIVLDRLLKDFSGERNVSQKDMLTVAMIEFLIKYGFEIEVEYMLNAGRG